MCGPAHLPNRLIEARRGRHHHRHHCFHRQSTIERAPGRSSPAARSATPHTHERQTREEILQDGDAAERLKALGHPVRLAIVRALAERSCCCCADVCSRLPLAQSTVSQHLKVLKDAGLISFRRDGVRSAYVLNAAAFAALESELQGLFAVIAPTPSAAGPAGEAG
jgi:ArsR family transcriptional regulator